MDTIVQSSVVWVVQFNQGGWWSDLRVCDTEAEAWQRYGRVHEGDRLGTRVVRREVNDYRLPSPNGSSVTAPARETT